MMWIHRIAVCCTVSLLFCMAAQAQQEEVDFSIVELDAVTFQALIEEGVAFDAVVDVRSLSEWESGHIANATLVESLASFNSESSFGDATPNVVGSPMDLAGCEYCNIAVYCNSGSRARTALGKLRDAGFLGRLYNGQGVTQWTAAGFELVTDQESVTPPCTVDDNVSEQCRLAYLAYTDTTGGDGGLDEFGDDMPSVSPAPALVTPDPTPSPLFFSTIGPTDPLPTLAPTPGTPPSAPVMIWGPTTWDAQPVAAPSSTDTPSVSERPSSYSELPSQSDTPVNTDRPSFSLFTERPTAASESPSAAPPESGLPSYSGMPSASGMPSYSGMPVMSDDVNPLVEEPPDAVSGVRGPASGAARLTKSSLFHVWWPLMTAAAFATVVGW